MTNTKVLECIEFFNKITRLDKTNREFLSFRLDLIALALFDLRVSKILNSADSIAIHKVIESTRLTLDSYHQPFSTILFLKSLRDLDLVNLSSSDLISFSHIIQSWSIFLQDYSKATLLRSKYSNKEVTLSKLSEFKQRSLSFP